MNEEISLVEVFFTVAVVGRERDQSDASSRRGQCVVSLSVCSEPGRGCEGTSCLSRGAGDDGAVGEALQAQLAHVGEDGLHVKLRHQLLEMKAHLLLTIPQARRKAAFPNTKIIYIVTSNSFCIKCRPLTLRYMRVGCASSSLWTLWLVQMRMMTLLRFSCTWIPPGSTVQWLNLILMALLSRLVSSDCSTSCTVSPDVDLWSREFREYVSKDASKLQTWWTRRCCKLTSE